MDPYDQPSTITVSQSCLKEWGKALFKDAFFAELNEHEADLRLDEMCSDRGYPDPDGSINFSGLKFKNRARPVVEGSFRVRFSGLQNGGCKDYPIPFPVDGRLYFKLDLRSGLVTFDRPQNYTDWGH